jgi:dolichol-phosphate mannosyltransferase
MNDTTPNKPDAETLAVVMPVYNEAGAIGPVVVEWITQLRALGMPFVLQAINDGSRDETPAILDGLAADWPELRVTHQRNRGHGPTLVAAYAAAMATHAWVFQTDSDGELPASAFPEVWKARAGKDAVMGYRVDRNAPRARKLVTGGMTLLLRICFGKGPRDGNCPYRLLKSETFLPLVRRLPANAFAPNVLLSGDIAAKRLSFAEVPVPFRPRETGECSIRKWKLARAALRSARQLFAHRFLPSPPPTSP